MIGICIDTCAIDYVKISEVFYNTLNYEYDVATHAFIVGDYI